MHVAELWRYPVKSMRGEIVDSAEVSADGHSRRPRNRRGSVGPQARHHLTHPSPPAGIAGRHLLRHAQGHDQWHSLGCSRGRCAWSKRPSASRWSCYMLPEQSASTSCRCWSQPTEPSPPWAWTAGGSAPTFLLAGLKAWRSASGKGSRFRLGEVEIHAAQLRARCVMTTYDPDTLTQDRNVLFRIVKEFDGTMALDCSVTEAGHDSCRR